MEATGQRYDARVHVFPRAEILDPQGKAIGEALGRLEFGGVSGVRAGKCFTMSIEAVDAEEARASVSRMCETLLANTVTEDYSVEIMSDPNVSTAESAASDIEAGR